MVPEILLIFLLLTNGTHSLRNGQVDRFHKFVVSIWQWTPTTHQYKCTGIMISKSHVLTAGHCVHNATNYDFFIFNGQNIPKQTDDSMLLVQDIYIHPDFQSVYDPAKSNTALWMNDIAVLRLECQPAQNLKLALGKLYHRSDYRSMSEYCRIAGWEQITTNMVTSLILNWASSVIMGIEESCQSNSFLLKNEIYAFLTHPKTLVEDTDSGAPLICNHEIVGIIIGENNRTSSVVTVLTVAPYLEFIDYIFNDGKVDVQLREFQSIVSIWNSDDFLCGGFIVDDYHIVTAAHCVHNVVNDQLKVLVGQINPGKNGLSVKSIKIHPHYLIVLDENFAIQHIENDIAVLKLTSALPWNPRFDLMKSPDESEVSGDKPIQVLRWALTASSDSNSETLVKSSAMLLLDELCGYFGAHLGVGQFCIVNRMKFPIASERDIGNPILYENSIIAMVIDFKPNIVSDYAPAVCLQIFPYREFINSTINAV